MWAHSAQAAEIKENISTPNSWEPSWFYDIETMIK